MKVLREEQLGLLDEPQIFCVVMPEALAMHRRKMRLETAIAVDKELGLSPVGDQGDCPMDVLEANVGQVRS